MAQIDGLKRQAEDARKQEISGAIAEIKRIMTEYSIDPSDLFPTRGGKVKRAGSGIVKYRDPVSGSGWSGRGRRPGWVAALEAQGKSIEDCLVA
ncbi:MAG: H-NS histone family protein [Pseudomonadota bacterium]|nr:H-NS histone family protein [Pseudomonadota bacterium]MDP1902854.1 H-NS histone family protein [Pseudomonadota bacterium]MDP2352832.1 H-NS histone family protein [Pseudomonadota bacterium]